MYFKIIFKLTPMIDFTLHWGNSIFGINAGIFQPFVLLSETLFGQYIFIIEK